jgi:hypothetical protein
MNSLSETMYFGLDYTKNEIDLINQYNEHENKPLYEKKHSTRAKFGLGESSNLGFLNFIIDLFNIVEEFIYYQQSADLEMATMFFQKEHFIYARALSYELKKNSHRYNNPHKNYSLIIDRLDNYESNFYKMRDEYIKKKTTIRPADNNWSQYGNINSPDWLELAGDILYLENYLEQKRKRILFQGIDKKIYEAIPTNQWLKKLLKIKRAQFNKMGKDEESQGRF